MRVRLIVKIKNDNFYQARISAGYPSALAMSKATGISQSSIHRYEDFRGIPVRKSMIERIERALRVPFEDLFPQEVISVTGKIPKRLEFVKETPILPENAIILLPETALFSAEEKEQKYERLEKAVDGMRERERLVLINRYGLFGQPALTYKEIGDLLGVTRERIRQIEARAIRKLRHPSRSFPILRDRIAYEGDLYD